MVNDGNGRIMLKRINYGWRIVATLLSYSAFGVGALSLRICVFPLLNLFIRTPRTRIFWSRTIIRASFRLFIEMMRLLGVLTYTIQNKARLERKGLLILANHPTLIDTIFLMAFVKQADCIVANHLAQNPFTRGPIRAANYIGNQQGEPLFDACERALQQGGNLIIFPEGTRTPRNGLLQFKRGGANIAIRCLRAVTPVVIRCCPVTLSKGNKWWQIPATIPHFRISVEEDISIHAYLSKTDCDTVASRQLNRDLIDYFNKKLLE